MKPATKQNLTFMGLLSLALTIPLIVFSINQSFEIRKKAFIAGGPATVSLSPLSGDLSPGEEIEIAINIDLGGEIIGGFSLGITYDEDVLEPLQDTVVVPEDLPLSYPVLNSVADGVVSYDRMVPPTSQNGFALASPTLGTLRFKVKDGAPAGATAVAFVTEGRWVSEVVSIVDGSYTFILGTAHDASYTIQGADTTSPETEITAGPDEGETISVASTTLTFSGSDNVTAAANLVYSWKLESEIDTITPWTTFSDGTEAALSNLTAGNYTFKVRARDEAENVDSSPDTRSFSVELGSCDPGEERDCTADNTCTGTQTCQSDQTWEACTTELNHCDENCDGTPETCQVADCTECSCTTGDTRVCVTTDNFNGTQTCASDVWGTCVKDTPHTCDEGYNLCTDDVCLADCGDCVPAATGDCVTADHFQGEKTCAADRTWGTCIKGTDCESGYTLCPDGTCQTECSVTRASLIFSFQLKGRRLPNADSTRLDTMKIFAREVGTTVGFDAAPWKKEIQIETNVYGLSTPYTVELDTLDGYSDNTYEFFLKGPQHLQVKAEQDVTLDLGAELYSRGFGLLPGGDLNGDNEVTGADVSIWVDQARQEGDRLADINGDGIVNGADLSIIITRLRTEGDK